MMPARPYTACHVRAAQHQALPRLRRRAATGRRPTTTAIAPPAPSARRSTTRTRSTSSARCRYGRAVLLSGARSSRAAACGRCRRASWSSARRPRKARCARPPRKPARRRARRAVLTDQRRPRQPGPPVLSRRMLDTDFVPGVESSRRASSAKPRCRGTSSRSERQDDARVLLRRPTRRTLELHLRRRRLNLGRSRDEQGREQRSTAAARKAHSRHCDDELAASGSPAAAAPPAATHALASRHRPRLAQSAWHGPR